MQRRIQHFYAKTIVHSKQLSVAYTTYRRNMYEYEGWNFNSGNFYLQLIQNRYMFRSFTVLQCSHQHCVQPVASDVEVVGYL